MRRLLNAGGQLPPRLRAYVLTTIVVGAACAAEAAWLAVDSALTVRQAVGIATFFVLAVAAELRPVPIDTEGRRLVSLAFVFIVASLVLFGWQWSVLIGVAAMTLAMLAGGERSVKVTFNAAVYAIAAAVSALPPALVASASNGSYLKLAGVVTAIGGVFVVTNVLFVCGAIGLASGEPVRKVFRDHLRHSGVAFAIMIFVAVQAVILWRLSAPLVLLLSGPLFSLTLYQRSSVGRRAAEEAAQTDSLTEIKNRRAFEDDVPLLLANASDGHAEIALCLIDIDRFKQVNDRHGHPAGDAVLVALSRAISDLAQGRGYRLGGDEFAIVVKGGERTALELTALLQESFAREQNGLVPEIVSISTGIALFPEHADDLHSLKKRADIALYQSKHKGKSAATLFVERDDAGLPYDLDGPEAATSSAGVAIAGRLAALVDTFADVAAAAGSLHDSATFSSALASWRASNGNHSRSVAVLTVALARRFGIEGAELEELETAALLHDLGKIAIPESILNRPGPLTDGERQLVERHAEIGHALLGGLDCGRVPEYVLHHHERWDGAGYPHGLAGAEIPFGSRLILVADAFDALTSDRAYRKSLSIESAMQELHLESGRQFDPLIVAALHEHLAHVEPVSAPFASAPLTIPASWSS